MATTPYDLPDVVIVSGTVHIHIESDSAGLTVPSTQTIKNLGTITQTANIDVSRQEVQKMNLTVMLDAAGWWVSIMYVNSTFKMTITESDAVTRFLFYGKLDPASVDWSMTSNISGVRTGTIRFDLLSMLPTVFAINTGDWIDTASTGVLANCITWSSAPPDGNVSSVMSIRGLFSAMLSVSGLNATYSLADTTFVWDGTNLDFDFRNTGAATRNVSQLFVPIKYRTGGVSTKNLYFDTANAASLPNRYGKLQDLMGAIARNFGLKVYLDYDTAGSRFKFKLLQCYRAYSTTLDFGTRLKREDFAISTDLLGDAAIARYINPATGTPYQCWTSQKYSAGATSVADPSTFHGLSFDLDTTILWKLLPSPVDTAAPRIFSYNGELTSANVYTDLEIVNDIYWWNYFTGAQAHWTDATGNYMKMEQAVSGYYAARMNNPWFKNISRYATIQATEGGLASVANIQILKRNNFSMGFGAAAKNYYANKTTIDLDNSEVEIEWIQESH